MANKCWFVYYSWSEAIGTLSDSEAGRLLKCCLKYSSTGEETVLTGNERLVWLMIKPQIDRDNAHAEDVSNKRRVAGSLSRSNCNQLQPIASNCSKRGEERRGKEEEKKRKDSSFVAPTLAEVADYCRERSNNVDPQRFLDYYESNGWHVGKNPMRDWKAAVRTWEKTDNTKPAMKTNNIFAQIAAEEGLF